MRIAISSTGKDLDSDIDMRFGRCPYFLVVEIDKKKSNKKKSKDVIAVENTASAQAGGAGITAAKIVAEQEVEAVITSNIGPRAFDVLSQFKIKVYLAEGKVKDALQALIKDRLEEISAPTGPQHMGI